MKMLDLFSGIGGFSLAASWVWGDELEIVAFVEIDKFCQKVLKKHWPEVPIISDIREVTVERIIADTTNAGIEGMRREWENSVFQIDLICGGFPCQPFSCAGKRKGQRDDRFLWPEMLRVIREVQPTWVIAENVSGIFTIEQGLVFEQVLSQMESEGYDIQPLCIPACAKDAPHRRDRFWFVAHSLNDTNRADRGEIRETASLQEKRGEALGSGMPTGTDCFSSNTRQQRKRDKESRLNNGQQSSKKERQWTVEGDGFTDEDCPNSYTISTGLQGGIRGKSIQYDRQFGGGRLGQGWGWQENWLEVATRLCRVDDGVSTRLDRVNRLKSLGNSIVPAVAYEILRAIKEINDIG
jgi:DNA (cytosine-5)-methyltransferase 1